MAKKKQDDWEGVINYLGVLANRISEIEKLSKTNLNETDQTKIYFERSAHKLKDDLQNLKKGIDKAKEIVQKQQDILKGLVKEFKGIAKHDQFMVLKEKVEQWAPDKFITRKEFNEKLKATSSDTSSQLSEPPARI
ncbi:hypothetical protein ACFLTH_17025 [Bacteroidota bacterium]